MKIKSVNAYTCQYCGVVFRRSAPKRPNLFCSRDCYSKYKVDQSVDVSARFWKYVNKTDSCWNWVGYHYTQSGYGKLTIRTGHRRHRDVGVHRLSWELNCGPIPIGKHVLHHCDNRSCVNPAHLYIGTPLENNRDTVNRHRHRSHWAGVTHCIRGHRFVPGSYRLSKTGSRNCLACEKIRYKARWATGYYNNRGEVLRGN